jgi:hypothetical protein
LRKIPKNFTNKVYASSNCNVRQVDSINNT